MHSGAKKEGSVSMNFNGRNAGGEGRGRNYSRGRPRRNPLTISDFMDQTQLAKISTVPTEAPRRRRRRGGRNQNKPLEERSSQTHIEDLNDDCLIHIFSLLPVVDRVRIQRVCTRWYAVSILAWQTLKKMNLKEDFWGVHYKKSKVTVNRDAYYKVLNLCGHFLTHIDLTKDVIGRIPRVRIESCKNILQIIKDTCPNLQYLNIGTPTSASAIEYITNHLPNLTGLTMEVSTRNYYYQSAVADLFRYCTNLKYLKMQICKISTPCLLDSNLQNLEVLDLYYSEFEDTESILKIINKLKALHTLILEHIQIETEWEKQVLQAVGSLTNLKKLSVVISYHLYTTLDANFICCLTNLEELKLGGFELANDEALEKISRNCQNLRKLQLISSNLITDESISHIAKFPRLEYLHLESLNSLNCKNLEKLSQIKYLDCKECQHIKNEGFVNLIASSENIRWINIFNCNLISDELIVKANNIASEKLYLTFDNSYVSDQLVDNKHSLKKVGNQIIKKFEKLCFNCYKECKEPMENCTFFCYKKVEVF